jgi:flagellar P-ring protein precursor FlgI
MRSWHLGLLLALALVSPQAAEAARVKDIAHVYGVRDNILTGTGLVTGLNRTGDSRRNEATSVTAFPQHTHAHVQTPHPPAR